VTILSVLFAAIIGVLFGNYASTALFRLPRGIPLQGFDSTTGRPPHCSNCGHHLRFFEYLPVLSWLSARGNCNYCGATINSHYTLLEVGGMILAMVLWLVIGVFDEYYTLLLALGVLMLLSAFMLRYDIKSTKYVLLAAAVLVMLLRTLHEDTIYGWIIGLFISLFPYIALRRNKEDPHDNLLLSLLLIAGIALPWSTLILYSITIMIMSAYRAKRLLLRLDIALMLLYVTISSEYIILPESTIVALQHPVSQAQSNQLPAGFTYLKDVAPEIAQDPMYATDKNFIGRVITGYEAMEIVCTVEAAQALRKVQADLQAFGLGLIVKDGYRPQMAVDDFKAWSLDAGDQKNKALYYPNIDKKDLFDAGFISQLSAHSRGSTVDLTLIDLASGQELNMGARIDFFGEQSYTLFSGISAEARRNRLLLLNIMEKHGFENYPKEWWHYQMKNEPFPRKPEDHLNFPIR
jgi:zinc D-Ala-D-Ala dipeptidase